MNLSDEQRLRNLMAWDSCEFNRPPADIRFLLSVIRQLQPAAPPALDKSPHSAGQCFDNLALDGSITHHVAA
ncbi:MAG: hypothetical protein EOO37_00005 [Cytophagaceae bacterium]|nr:MAG: hypothetical protein EOO37_00005 [Cytophagaceae bacterium]